MTWPQWYAAQCLKLSLKNVYIYKCAYCKFYWYKECAAHDLQITIKYTVFFIVSFM